MHASIQQLYRVFHPYRLGEDFCGTSFAVSHADYRALTAKPLSELEVVDVEHYVAHAMTIWGNVGHFKHFLPRLMQLTTDQYFAFERPNAIFAKLDLARWRTWPAEQRKAVRRCLMHFWERQLAVPGDFPVDERIESALHGLYQACGSLQPFLDRWLTMDDQVAALHLGQVITYVSSEADSDDSRRRLGGLADAVRDQVSCWLSNDAVTEYLCRHQDVLDQSFPNVLDQMRSHQQRRIDDAVVHSPSRAARPVRESSQPRIGRA